MPLIRKLHFYKAKFKQGLLPLLLALGCSTAPMVHAEENLSEDWSVHGQYTMVTQWHGNFRALYSGENSLTHQAAHATTNDATLFLGYRLGPQTEFYLNPEVDQGFGLSDTLGAAGFTSGAAYKVGEQRPYVRMPRLFVRHVVELGGEVQKLDPDANQLAGSRSADNLTFTLGKMSVVDIFDNNKYAHDTRGDFLNWSILDAGAFDYAADAWGFTYGIAAEWAQGDWTWRNGLYDLSNKPNSTTLEINFRQFEVVSELEHRHVWAGHPGAVKGLVFMNRGDMGSYQDALALYQQDLQACLSDPNNPSLSCGAPKTANVRRYASRLGWAFNLEQELMTSVGVFAKVSMNQGSKEAFEFTEINQSVVLGTLVNGTFWQRADDSVGVAYVQNGLSNQAKSYFAAGGMGILIGDGALTYGSERIFETFYNWQATKGVALALDYQRIVNPGYNQARGPVNVAGLRLHAEF
jgi:high affinity Mn2+ porin